MLDPRLYPYQREGARFLADRERAYLADPMGLGKTVQAIQAVFLSCGFNGGVRPRVLVVCPASLVRQWESEIEEWGGNDSFGGSDWYVLSYGKLRDIAGFGFYDFMIFDEAHYLKNPEAVRTTAAVELAATKLRGSLWLLSGTPMPNDPRELWVPARLMGVDAGLGYWDWARRYCDMVRFKVRNRWVNKVRGGKRLHELEAMFRPVMLRREADRVLKDLPPLRVTTERLGVTARDLGITDHMLKCSDSDESAMRQIGKAKAQHIAKVLADELERGEYGKIVVMCQHHDVMEEYGVALRDFGVVRLDGTMGLAHRVRAVSAFEHEDNRVFVVQQQAGGVGLNLQCASEMVMAEPDWSPDVNRQAIKRIHRIGQDSPCRARLFMLPGSRDEKVLKAVALKMQMQKEVGLS